MSELTRGRLLARNTGWNLLSQGVPMLAALIAIPFLIHGLGTHRFGVLTLVWVAIGYFSLFDLGLGRALTQLVAERLGTGREEEIPSLTWTALVVVFLMGAMGSLLLILLAPWLVRSALNIPPELHQESVYALYLLALSLPWMISGIALRGLLEAVQRFDLVAAVRIPTGAFSFLGPLLVLPFSSSLVPVVAVLLVSRFAGWALQLLLCLRAIPELRARIRLQFAAVGPLLRFGGWMTITNVVSPIMVYADRLLIGAFLSVAAVAYYVTPYEVVTKMWLIPGALVGVLFPAFATSFAADRAHTAALFDRGLRLLVLVLFPLTLLAVSFAHLGLELWVGSEFAENGARVAQWLAVGVFLNCLAQVPFAVVQGAGRPDLTGKLHLVELPLYLLAMGWLLSSYGIIGVAVAWTVRAGLDMVVLLAMARRFLPESAASLRRINALIGGSLLALTLVALPAGLLLQTAFAALVLGLFGIAAWRYLLTSPEQLLVRSRLALAWKGAFASSASR
ncbi:MAG: flippase [Longimicrobiaceae bacterium]